MTDDQNWRDLIYNGLKHIQIPNLDALAETGMRFDQFYATPPSCSPNRASVMRGHHPNQREMFWPGMPLRRQEIMIA
jgi:arylsulfatase A-like enzyme